MEINKTEKSGIYEQINGQLIQRTMYFQQIYIYIYIYMMIGVLVNSDKGGNGREREREMQKLNT